MIQDDEPMASLHAANFSYGYLSGLFSVTLEMLSDHHDVVAWFCTVNFFAGDPVDFSSMSDDEVSVIYSKVGLVLVVLVLD